MVKVSECARRYASALFDLAKEAQTQDVVLNQLRALRESFSKQEEIKGFIETPLLQPNVKEKALQQALSKSEVGEELKSFITLLAKKNRLPLFYEITTAYEQISDLAHGVTRGTVTSTEALSPAEREEIQDIISKKTGKRVILTFEEDESLVGGLVAHVGSYTFDDTINGHLKRLKEDLNRSLH